MNVLVVDDDTVTLELLNEVLEQAKYKVLTANSVNAALAVLTEEHVSIVLSDIRMEDQGDGFSLLNEIRKRYPEIVVIMMTGFGSMSGAIEAIQQGAFDYISKPFDLEQLQALVDRAAKHARAQKTNKDSAKAELVPELPKTLIGRSPKMVEVYRTIARATLSTSGVLITGESGTGKELVARAIHQNGSRKNASFVAVNCGALTETLLESELFGYVKGAFTGAMSDRSGLFEEAHGGTLFLDEVGDIPLGLQVKLLRVLQEGEIRRVGSNQNKKIDVRVIAATHRNLAQLIEEGKFREDLYYRLKVIEVRVPSLRERSDDIPDLTHSFLIKAARRSGKGNLQISSEAMKKLQHYRWPGNVRELEHQVERAVALTSSSVLAPDDFDLDSHAKAAPKTIAPEAAIDPRSLEELEKAHILKVLKQVNYNKSKAAEILGIDRVTLYRKAQKFGLMKEDDEG